jgi:hypothetical protein
MPDVARRWTSQAKAPVAEGSERTGECVSDRTRRATHAWGAQHRAENPFGAAACAPGPWNGSLQTD